MFQLAILNSEVRGKTDLVTMLNKDQAECCRHFYGVLIGDLYCFFAIKPVFNIDFYFLDGGSHTQTRLHHRDIARMFGEKI